jgi:hypothetical protein
MHSDVVSNTINGNARTEKLCYNDNYAEQQNAFGMEKGIRWWGIFWHWMQSKNHILSPMKKQIKSCVRLCAEHLNPISPTDKPIMHLCINSSDSSRHTDIKQPIHPPKEDRIRLPHAHNPILTS